MRIIRTGNDIKVIFTIKGPASTDTVNMKQLRVYFVNKFSDKCHFVKRFPKEPFPQFYEPSKYTIHGCGRFGYNVRPSYNKCEYAVCSEGFHDYHIWPSYNGFGIIPEKFHDSCHKPEPEEFTAPFVLEEGSNDVSAYFPACQQKNGIYRMIVVMTAYESGWGKCNLHTYTIDYGDIFELTCKETGEQGNIVIDLRDVGPTPPPGQDEHYIGFSSVENADDVNIAQLTKVNTLKKDFLISNSTGNWAYLWIVSTTPINKLTISGQDQPIKQLSRSDYKYCYRSYQKLDQTSFKFTIS